jgi:hypothetical protein
VAQALRGSATETGRRCTPPAQFRGKTMAKLHGNLNSCKPQKPVLTASQRCLGGQRIFRGMVASYKDERRRGGGFRPGPSVGGQRPTTLQTVVPHA